MAHDPIRTVERDTRLVELLAELESLGQRDQAIRDLASYLGGILKAGSHDSGQGTATLNQIPLSSVLPPALATVESAVPTPPTPTSTTLAEHPLASHVLSILPYDMQVTLHQVMQRVTFSIRTFAAIIVLAICLGLYTGHIAIPASVRDYLSTTCQPPKVQP